MTASMIQSTSRSLARSSVVLPRVRRSFVDAGSMNAGGRARRARSRPARATASRSGPVFGGEIEEQGRDPGVGEVRGDGRAHRARADDGRAMDFGEGGRRIGFRQLAGGGTENKERTKPRPDRERLMTEDCGEKCRDRCPWHRRPNSVILRRVLRELEEGSHKRCTRDPFSCGPTAGSLPAAGSISKACWSPLVRSFELAELASG